MNLNQKISSFIPNQSNRTQTDTMVVGKRIKLNSNKTIMHVTLTILILVAITCTFEVATPRNVYAASPLEYAVDATTATGGVFARFGPHTSDTNYIDGYGVYPNDTVELLCGVTDGDSVGPFNNKTWHFIADLSNPGEGDFWVSDHYLDTPNPPGQLASGEAQCTNESSNPISQSAVNSLPCTAFLLIAARGSGPKLPGETYIPDNNAANTTGFTQTLAPIADSLTAYYGASNITNYSLPYQAAPALALIDGAYGNDESFWQSLGQGEVMLENILQQQEQACPYQVIFLAGYSQGAAVIGNAISDDPSIDSNIAGVVLFGDPQFNPSSQTAQGNFDHGLQGVLGARSEYPSNMIPIIRSYCLHGDAICNWSTPNSTGFLDGNSPHFHYPDTSYVIDAASFLESLSPNDQVQGYMG